MPSNNGDTDKIPSPRDHLAEITRDGLTSQEPSRTLCEIRKMKENPPPPMKEPKSYRW